MRDECWVAHPELKDSKGGTKEGNHEEASKRKDKPTRGVSIMASANRQEFEKTLAQAKEASHAYRIRP